MDSQQFPEDEQPKKYVKIVLVGQSGVGKTNIISRYVENKFSFGTTTTIGLEFSEKFVRVNKQSMVLQIWDTAGQERFRALNKTFYHNSLGAVLIFDLSNRETFTELERWLAELRQNVSQSTVFLLIGNKSDKKDRKVSVSQAFQMAKREGMGYIETSAALGTNIKQAFEMLTQKIVEIVQKIRESSKDSASEKLKKIKPKKTLLSPKPKKKPTKCCL